MGRILSSESHVGGPGLFSGPDSSSRVESGEGAGVERGVISLEGGADRVSNSSGQLSGPRPFSIP